MTVPAPCDRAQHLLATDLGGRAGPPPQRPHVSEASKARVRAVDEAERRADVACGHLVLDPHAEEVCAAVAVQTAAGAERIAAAVPTGDWYDARCLAVVDAAVTIGRPRWTREQLLERGSIDRRTDLIADATGLDPWWLAGLVRRSPVLHDWSGSYAGRVRAAATRRRDALQLCRQLEEMGLALTVEVPS